MVALGFTLVLVCCIYGIYRIFSRIPQYRFGWSGVWRLACLFAGLRIAALWFGHEWFAGEGCWEKGQAHQGGGD